MRGNDETVSGDTAESADLCRSAGPVCGDACPPPVREADGTCSEPDPCGHFVYEYDCTFPYASGSLSCPLDGLGRIDLGPWERLNAALTSLLTARRNVSGGPLSEESTVDEDPLAQLIADVTDAARWDGDEFLRDECADLAAFRTYLLRVLRGSPVFHGVSSFADSTPMLSSVYEVIWATDGQKCADDIGRALARDTAALLRLLPTDPRHSG